MVRTVGSSSAALNELCTRYRSPILKLVKRYGFPDDEAEDVVQDYFASLLGRDYLAKADRETGRFRAFVSHDLKLFLNNARRRKAALRRGGGAAPLSLDQMKEEFGFDPSGSEDQVIDEYFDRQWAQEIFKHAFEQLGEDYRNRGQEEVFRCLRKGLHEDAGDSDYADWSERLGKSPGNVRVLMHRLRERFRRIVEDSVRNTVASEEDFDLEMSHLRSALAS